MAKTNAAVSTNPFDQMEALAPTEVAIPKRGRAVSPIVAQIREALEKSLADNTVRSIPCETKEDSEEFSRKIRSAAKMAGKDEIKVSFRFVPEQRKLVFGTSSVFKSTARAA